MVELAGGLVVPTAPGFGAIERDDGSLIDGQHHMEMVGGVDPEEMIIVAAGSAFDWRKGFTPVRGAIQRNIGEVHDVGIFGVDGDSAEIPSPATDTRVCADAGPVCAGIVGAKEPSFFGFDQRVDAMRTAGCDGDPDAPKLTRGKAATGELGPGIAAVGGFVESAAGAFDGRIRAPGRTLGLP